MMGGNVSHGESILFPFFFSFFLFWSLRGLRPRLYRVMLKSHIWGIDGGVMFGPPSLTF